MKDQDILLKTLELASRLGLRSLSLSDIAKECGISKSTLYSHFESKENLFERLYLFLREKAKERNNIPPVDYNALFKDRTLKEILRTVTSSYSSMVHDKDLNAFYRVVLSEKSFSPIAASIYTEETNTMLLTTRNLFYALSSKGLAHFSDVDNEAMVFAFTFHSILVLEEDDRTAGTAVSEGLLDSFLEYFSSIHSKGKIQ